MKVTLLLLLATAAITTQGGLPQQPEPMLASVQSVDAGQEPVIRIDIEGSPFRSLGIPRGAKGTLELHENVGRGTGTLWADLSDQPGVLMFSASRSGPELELRVWPTSGAEVPRYRARGHTVRVVRSASGVVFVQTGR